MMRRSIRVACLTSALLLPAGVRAGPGAVHFGRDVRPLLADNCFQCHGPDEPKRKAGLRLDLADGATRPADSGAVDGLVMSGMISVPAPELSQGRGGLSGPRILPNAIRNVRELYEATGGRLSISALGGISSGADAFAAIAAGATTVELYTSFVYQGPGVVRRIATELLELLERSGVRDVNELRGSGAELPNLVPQAA